MNRNIFTSLTVLAATMAAVAGCNSSKYDKEAYDFDPQRSRTRAVLDAQYAKGAAEDAALTTHHFDGLALNGLGRDKLTRMLAYHTKAGKIAVYVDLVGASAAEAEPRLQAVRDYLSAKGVAVTGETVVLGPSPQSVGASEALAGVKRLDERSSSASDGSTPADVVANQNSGLFSEK